MQPELFSPTIGPPWHPEAWDKSPDQLRREAQVQLFEDFGDVVNDALGTDRNAMSGAQQSPYNEAEELIGPGETAGVGRSSNWDRILKDLRRTEPLPGDELGDPRSPQDLSQVQANTAD